MSNSIYPSGELTVMIRDDGPLVHCGDSPAFRTVRIQLTPDQIAKLALRRIGTSNGAPMYEDISRIIMEPHHE
jgi:hypothetical protein